MHSGYTVFLQQLPKLVVMRVECILRSVTMRLPCPVESIPNPSASYFGLARQGAPY